MVMTDTRDRITVAELQRTYGTGATAVHALRDVSFAIKRGESIALTGPSGSGKTTLLNCLLGLDSPSSGSVDAFGASVHDMTYEAAVAWRRAEVAIVFQTTGLLPHLTARENVDMVLRIRKVDRHEREARIDETFQQMQIAAFADHRPSELSGGQRQRVALARALATRPALLVADEPTGELDTDTTATVLDELVASARVTGTTMILATHDRDVEAVADRTLRLVDGRVERGGT